MSGQMQEGSPHPRGATWDGKGTNFAVFSAHATKVEVCFFDESGEKETDRIANCPNTPTRSGMAISPTCAPARVYGSRPRPLRARRWASLQSQQAAARSLRRAPTSATCKWNPALFGYQMESRDDTTFDERDSAPFMPKCVVVDPRLRLERAANAAPVIAFPGTTPSSTSCTSAVSPSCIPPSPISIRGTYAGLAHPEVIDYIKSLGVTSVELLPIHTFVTDSHLLEKGLTNYWGYNTIGFFAPDPRYAANPADSSARVQGDGGALSRCRARSHSRRGLQPHRRRQRARARRSPSKASTTPATTG